MSATCPTCNRIGNFCVCGAFDDSQIAPSRDPICACGHPFSQHNKWWDIGGAESNGGPSCGMGCDVCDCDDSTVGL